MKVGGRLTSHTIPGEHHGSPEGPRDLNLVAHDEGDARSGRAFGTRMIEKSVDVVDTAIHEESEASHLFG